MKKILFVLVLTVLVSCTIKTHYIQDDAQSFEKTDPQMIKVYSSNDVGQPYDVIGSVAVDSPGGGEDALKALKEEAALLGANAIINVKLGKISSLASSTGLSGVAVRIR